MAVRLVLLAGLYVLLQAQDYCVDFGSHQQPADGWQVGTLKECALHATNAHILSVNTCQTARSPRDDGFLSFIYKPSVAFLWGTSSFADCWPLLHDGVST
jgi:hypothetical protein